MLIYTEDFASPYEHYVWGATTHDPCKRFGCDNIKIGETWYPNMVPYIEFAEGYSDDYVAIENKSDGIGRILSLRTSLSYYRPKIFYNHIYLSRSKNLTVGMLVEFFEYSRDADLVSQFCFESYLDDSRTHITNFIVNIIIKEGSKSQKADISFETGGSGYPDISPVTVYYDFNQPLWIWVRCDMTNGADGTCQVWFNNDLMVTKENIYTGDVDSWIAQPLYEDNNVVTFGFGAFEDGSRPETVVDLHAITVVNEELTYMDTALGDIAVTGLLPSSIPQSQWHAHLDGVDLEDDAVEVFENSLHTDYEDLHTKAHMRANVHLMRDTYQYNNLFANGTEIFAVTQRLVHKMYDMDSGDAVLRIEPVIHTSGRDVLLDRTKGQLSEGFFKTLFVNYTTPYAGAFWNLEILDLTSFGFTLFQADRHEFVDENLNLLGEYDIENIYDEVGLGDLIIDGATP